MKPFPPWIAPGIVILAALISYHNTFQVPLLFDDALAITYNHSIRTLWPLTSVFAPPSECTLAGRPIANLTFALNYAVGGGAVRGYHVVNLGLHIGAALVLFGVVRRALTLPAVNTSRDIHSRALIAEDSTALALAIATIWVAHPLLTASVTYLSQRTEVLMGLFYLASVYAFIRGTAGSTRWLWLSVALCFLGIATKESMVTAPVFIALFDRTFVAGTFKAAWRQRRGYYLGLASSWLLLALLMTGLEDRAVGFGLGIPWWNYALTECVAILRYVGLVVWPFPLIFDYGAWFVDRLANGWLSVLGVVFLLGTTVAVWRRYPKTGFLAAAFFLILAPTSSVVPIATQPIAENRMYLPSAVGVALLILGLRRASGRLGWWAAAGVAMGMISLTVARNSVFQDPLLLWSDNVVKRPSNPRAYGVLAETLHARGRLPEAKHNFEAALRLKPDYHEAHANLASTLFTLGDAQGARFHLETAIRLRPDYAPAHNNLGNILLQMGDLEKAAYHCGEALRLFSQPGRLQTDFAESHNNLGNIRLHQGRVEEAQRHYAAAVQAKPDFHQARMNLGVMLRLLGQLDAAGEHLQIVVSARPDFAEGQFNLGVLWRQVSRLDDAVKCFRAAIQLKPEFPEALVGLGGALLAQGDLVGSQAAFEAALRLRPQDSSISAGLREVATAIGRKGGSAEPRR